MKRLAYELRPAGDRPRRTPAASTTARPAARAADRICPRVPAAPAPAGVDAQSMARQMESMLTKSAGPAGGPATASEPSQAIVDFVCEEDVRQAIRLGRTIAVGERTIITPSARDLAATHRVLVSAAWPRV